MIENAKVKKKKKRILGKASLLGVYESPKERIEISEPIVKRIGEFADKLGEEVHIVGGYVRDYYLDRPRHDFDFTVVGDSIDFAQKLAKEFNTKAVVYERFRTAMVPLGEFACEFVGTRKEIYRSNSRKPVTEQGTLKDDLKRRDFTINAMAASVNKKNFGTVTDLFNGMGDMKHKLLRTPLDPTATFNDDPLRMMRAARFAAQIGFEIDPRAKSAASAMAERLRIVSKERISDEFMKLIEGDHPGHGVRLLKEMNLLQVVFPELADLAGVSAVRQGEKEYSHKEVLDHSIQVLDKIAETSDNPWLRFAALVHDIGKTPTKKFSDEHGWTFHGHEEVGARMMKKVFRRMKLPMHALPYVDKLIRLHQRPMHLVDSEVTDSAIRRLAVKAGDELQDLFDLCRADITTKNPDKEKRYLRNYDIVARKVVRVREKDKLAAFQSPVRGEEIMEICDLPPSRPVGMIKEAIEEAILEGEIPNEYDAAKEYFLEKKDEWLDQIESFGKIPGIGEKD